MYIPLSKYCTTSHKDGHRLFEIIKESITAGMPVTISYKNTVVVPSFWLNIVVGQLYGFFSESEIKKGLEIIDASEYDLVLLKKVIDNAKRYFSE